MRTGPLSLLAALVVSAVGFVGPAHAHAAMQGDDGESEPVILVGSDLEIARGETIRGDVIVLGGNVLVQAGGVVEGNVLALGGDIWVDGAVNGNVVSIGGVASASTRASIGGQVFMLGRRGIRALPFPIQSARDAIATRTGKTVSAAISALAMGPLAAMAALLAPTALTHIRQAVTHSPVTAGVIGVLSLAVGILVAGLMAATCIFIPLAVVAAALLVVGAILGWSALGLLLGGGLLQVAGIDVERFPWVGALLGTMILTIVVRLVVLAPGGSLISLALGTLVLSVGLGAVALTRFGSRPHE